MPWAAPVTMAFRFQRRFNFFSSLIALYLKKAIHQREQHGKAANENIYLADPAENTEKNFIFEPLA
jgi:hypothetical protein